MDNYYLCRVIQVPMLSTLAEEILTVNKSYIDLEEKYIKWVVQYTCMAEDSKGIRREHRIYNHATIPKRQISATRLFESNETPIWVLEVLSCSGETISLTFNTFAEAKPVHEQILKWLYS